MKKIRFLDTSFRDGFQSVIGARVVSKDFIPAIEAAVEAGWKHLEVGGGARFQSPFFYCGEDAFEMMDTFRKVVGPEVELQTLARGVNVVGLSSQSSDIIDLHAKMFKKHGMTTIRNFDALNDIRNISYSGTCIHKAGLKHQTTITMMGLPPNMNTKAHSPEFYVGILMNILKSGMPFDSLCFKDASGTCAPTVIYETIKKCREILDAEGKKDCPIEMHTHDTADMSVQCYMAAIEGGAEIIDLAMRPMSGGTSQPDLLTMWHAFKGTEYTLDLDPEKIMKVEDVFIQCMSKYMIPPEAKTTNPLITLCPLPGGALTANTQMMRDNNCLDKFPEVVAAMREVVEKGGFGTSVTPVSQFYFQQAFANVMQGKWKKITPGYGKMVLGYFGKTPASPDPEIVKLAAEQLKMEPTTEDPRAINDKDPNKGIEHSKKVLTENGLPLTDENIFIIATCDETSNPKGLKFLKGERPMGVRYAEEASAKKAAPAAGPVTVNVNGTAYQVNATAGANDTATVVVNGKTYNVSFGAAAPAAAAPAAAGAGQTVTTPLPGTIVRISVAVGQAVKKGDELMIIEAMKMEQPIVAPADGTVKSIAVNAGDTLEAGQTVAEI
ncbi:MAG: biotin/lipoyl-binding protein [Lentisphaeria bacterium]|nr:biotin/lipoyl-binding protein [Lentisphaeria bacterium]